jgi:hypothetical protein
MGFSLTGQKNAITPRINARKLNIVDTITNIVFNCITDCRSDIFVQLALKIELMFTDTVTALVHLEQAFLYTSTNTRISKTRRLPKDPHRFHHILM